MRSLGETMEKDFIHVGVKMDPALVKILDEIAEHDEMTRSQVLRKLVKQEASRRAVEIVKNGKPASKRS